MDRQLQDKIQLSDLVMRLSGEEYHLRTFAIGVYQKFSPRFDDKILHHIAALEKLADNMAERLAEDWVKIPK